MFVLARRKKRRKKDGLRRVETALRQLTVVQLLGRVVDVDVLVVEREAVAAVLGGPDVAVGVEAQGDGVAQAVREHGALGVEVVTVGGGGGGVEDLDDGAAGAGARRGVVPVVVAADRHDDEVRVLGRHQDGAREVHALRDAADDGLLVAEGLGDRVVRPRVRGRLRARVERRPVGRQREAVVEARVLHQALRARHAPVLPERVHRDPARRLQHQHVARRVEDDRPRLRQRAQDLRHLPPRVHRVRVPGRRDARARRGEGEGWRILGERWRRGARSG